MNFAEFLGGSTRLYGEVEPGLAIVAEGPRGAAPAPGSRMNLAVDPANMRFFEPEGRRLQ